MELPNSQLLKLGEKQLHQRKRVIFAYDEFILNMRTYIIIIIIMSLFFMLSACGNQSGGRLEGRNGGGGYDYENYPEDPRDSELDVSSYETWVEDLTDEVDSLKSVLSEINSLASDALDSENIEEIYDILEEIQTESQ